MKKSAKQTGSKRNKERKHIQIKQSKQISPVKQVFEPEDSRFVIKTQQHQKSIPHLTKVQIQLSQEEIQNLSTHADSLISIQLMKIMIKKQQTGLQQFYEQCPTIVKKAFEKTLKNVESSFSMIRQQRIQRMKDETVIFIPPDKDNFERQKGRTLNNWIKQYQQVHQQKQNFDAVAQNFSDIFTNTEKRINNLAMNVPKQKIQPDLQKIANQIIQNNQKQIKNKFNIIQQDLNAIIQTTNEMRKTKETVIEDRVKNDFRRQIQCHRHLIQRYPTHTMALFSVEDYFT